LVQAFAAGTALPPITLDRMRDINSQQAAEHATVGKADVLGVLEANCGAVVAGLSALADMQLDATRDFYGYAVSVEAAVAYVLNNHIHEHYTSIRSILPD
jgi:hypothetical protein